MGGVAASCVSQSVPEPPELIEALDAREAYVFAPLAAIDAQGLPQSVPWEVLGGAELVGLIARTESESLSVLGARARIAQAAALVREARSGLLPSISQSFSIGTSRSRDQTGEFSWDDTFGLTGSMSWDADLFGGQRRAVDAARLRHAASRLAEADAQRQVSAAVARAYVAAWSLARQIEIAKALVDSFRETEAVTDARYRAGSRTTSALDVQIARQNLAAARASLPALEAQYAGQLIVIDVLLGQTPGGTALTFEAALDHAVFAVLDPGLPADLLRRRPDVALAELNYRAAIADVDTARARLRPSLTLSGSLINQTSDLDQLFDPEEILADLTSSLLAPVYQGGRLRAGVERAEASAEEVSLAYVDAILTALSEVERALLDESAAVEQVARTSESLAAAQLSEQLSTERYASGQVSLLNLLETRRALNTARQELVQAHERRLIARIDLYTALGGNAVVEEPQP